MPIRKLLSDHLIGSAQETGQQMTDSADCRFECQIAQNAQWEYHAISQLLETTDMIVFSILIL